MRSKSFLTCLGISSAIVISSFLLTDCTKMITEQQLAQMRELRKKEKSLNEEIAKKKGEKSRVETELNARKAEVKKCEEERAFIQEKLAAWPNVWPDYKPEVIQEQK